MTIVVINNKGQYNHRIARSLQYLKIPSELVSNELSIEEIDAILNEHYDEALSLEELGYRLHGSSSYLRHVYKKIKGIKL